MKRHLIQLVKYFDKISKDKDNFTIAIDGPGGSGKSTFANTLGGYLPNCEVIQFDEFYIPESDPMIIGSNFDWKRLINQVLLPFKNTSTCKYQIYDWNTNTLNEWKKIENSKYIIIEGVTASRLELREYIDFIIFINVPYEIGLARGIERDGIEIKEKWVNNWMPREKNYLESLIHKPKDNADLVIDGTYSNNENLDILNILKDSRRVFN